VDDGPSREVVALFQVQPIDADLVAGHLLEWSASIEEQGEIVLEAIARKALALRIARRGDVSIEPRISGLTQ